MDEGRKFESGGVSNAQKVAQIEQLRARWAGEGVVNQGAVEHLHNQLRTYDNDSYGHGFSASAAREFLVNGTPMSEESIRNETVFINYALAIALTAAAAPLRKTA